MFNANKYRWKGENEYGRKSIDDTCIYPVSYTHLDVYKRQDMFQPGVIVREGLPHLLAAVKALDDFRNVQAGLHVGVQEGFAGVIEACLLYTSPSHFRLFR